MMQYISEQEIEKLAQHDIFFFSDISLAVTQPSDRKLFWLMLDELKKADVQIVFDPNYRARMWDSQLQAKTEFEQAFTRADVVLPGIEDFTALYGFTTYQSICDFLAMFKVSEIIVKNRVESINCLIGGEEHIFDIEQSVKMVSAAAAFVIQHRGAIVPEDLFQSFLTKNESLLVGA